MSHYTVAVIHEGGVDIEELLAPYDEEIRVEPYIHLTKAEVVEQAKLSWPSLKGASDDECWEEYVISWDISPEFIDEEKNIYSTYNPKAKWDWYVVGGRFSDFLGEKIGLWENEVRLSDIDKTKKFVTYAVVTPDGEWHAPGEVGWFGTSTDTKEEYNKWAENYWTDFIETMDQELYLTIVDCHI